MTQANEGRAVVRGVLFLAAFIGYFVPIAMPLFVRNIAADLHVDVSTIGTLAGVQSLAVGLASLVVGPVSDRYGRKAVLCAALVASAAALGAFGASWNAPSLWALGVASAVAFSPLVFCSIAYVGDHFAPEQRGGAVGFITASMWAGVIVGTPLAVLLMEVPELGWRATFMACGALALAVAVVAGFALEQLPVATAARVQIRPVIDKYLSFAKRGARRRAAHAGRATLGFG